MDDALFELPDPLAAPAVAGCLAPDFSTDFPVDFSAGDDFSPDELSEPPFVEVEPFAFFASVRLSVR